MAMQRSQRSIPELVWLVLAGGMVAGSVYPLWKHLYAAPELPIYPGIEMTRERLARLLIGPEQIACYVATLWALLILFGRKLEIWRQRGAFRLDLLPTDEGIRILPEDARPLVRKIDQVTARHGPSILATMIRLGLGKYAISRSAPDVAEIVRSQAEVEQGRLITSLNLVQYLAWAIPAIGFLGTVRGLSLCMSMAGIKADDLAKFLSQATQHLGIAFDCTLVALGLSLLLMYFLHTTQRDEEILIIDCQQYCQEHLLLRLYDPQPDQHRESGALAGAGLS